MPHSPTTIAKARYAGRALALVKFGGFRCQNGEYVYHYTSPNGKTYVVDVRAMPICDCDEYKSNLHLLAAARMGKKVWRNPGVTCKHILAARVLRGNLDIHGAIENMAPALREMAKIAYFAEVKRLHN